jgi:hypothetical protein
MVVRLAQVAEGASWEAFFVFDGNYLLDAGSYDTYANVIIAPYSLTPCRKFRALPSVAAEVALEGSKLRVLLP